MAQEETENSFPIQIRHNTDGWFFLPKEYNKEGNAWLYECPSCQAQIIITPLTVDPISEPQVSLSETPPTQKPRPKRSSTRESPSPESLLVESEGEPRQEP